MVITKKLKAEGKLSSEETDILFLRSQDFDDGLIRMQQPAEFLKNMENSVKTSKYALNHETKLLISMNKRNDSRFRTAVFDPAKDYQGKTLLVNSNIYILTLDEEKVNPYYVQAYLESSEGQEKLSQAAAGAAIARLDIADLRMVAIPVCDMETQNRIAEKFKKNLEEIRICKDRLSELYQEKDKLFPQD